jgi:excisionase family DNA binding protein
MWAHFAHIAHIERPHSQALFWRSVAVIDELKSKAATARMLGISKESLDRLRKAGRIQAIRIGGRVLFADAEIQAFIQRSLEKRKSAA